MVMTIGLTLLVLSLLAIEMQRRPVRIKVPVRALDKAHRPSR